ncbi:hypothetical protein H3H37_05330 [Duganella sp. LX20W]|uniref:Uncharacterized protein n=1 Tax=Rugamonas brunnea TaxID=2758569 RepID=A0A7W2EPY1_9BURK|nr:hypothetical protein [Rugamonas brunnea]MBA5636472.1 hypothetical protein [Rugamonas brunnea]
MKINKVLLTAALATLIAPAFAQNTATPKIDARQERQEMRIDQGINSGQLTGKETANLEKREAKIEADKVKAEADGKVTRQERAHLNRELDHSSNKIYRKKHNARTAG